MLTIFGNLLINNQIKLQHLKDSFNSFNSISDNWLINIRGKCRREALMFLEKKLGDKMIAFDLVDDSRGWAQNALEMLSRAKYDHVLIWNEDHLNLAPQEIFAPMIEEIAREKVDFMQYSVWGDGDIRACFEETDLKKFKYIDTIKLTPEIWDFVLARGYRHYFASLLGIMSKGLFRKLLLEDIEYFKNKLPYSFRTWVYRMVRWNGKYFDLLNKYVFCGRLPKSQKEAPFNLEKPQNRVDLLPIQIAFPKQEIFACIDDDFKILGYSLISRGLYNPKLSTHKQQSLIKSNLKTILNELETVLSKIDEVQVENLVQEIVRADKIVAIGAGRVGMAAKAFVMRLAHMGFKAYMVGDTTVPAVGKNDLLLVSSGSGETQTIFDLMTIGKNNGARTVLITGNKDSRMGKMADTIVEIKAPSKTKPVDNFVSIQPMTTLNEQCLMIFFDAVVLDLMSKLLEDHDAMWRRHSNLE